jgi:hypothetical protein
MDILISILVNIAQTLLPTYSWALKNILTGVNIWHLPAGNQILLTYETYFHWYNDDNT